MYVFVGFFLRDVRFLLVCQRKVGGPTIFKTEIERQQQEKEKKQKNEKCRDWESISTSRCCAWEKEDHQIEARALFAQSYMQYIHTLTARYRNKTAMWSSLFGGVDRFSYWILPFFLCVDDSSAVSPCILCILLCYVFVFNSRASWNLPDPVIMTTI